MNEQLRKAIELEKRCFNMFTAMGWDTSTHMQTELSPNHYFRPDITLSHNNEIIGCVEVKTSFNNDSRTMQHFVERVRFMLTEFKPTVFIFTNGYIFDLYLEGDYFNQLTFVPSPEDIALFLNSKKGGN